MSISGTGRDSARRLFDRRQLLLAGAGVGAVGALAMAGCSRDVAPPRDIITVTEWRATRRAPYLIGHRGVGDLLPEHTLPSYDGAKAVSAAAIEVSVVISSDGVLFCQHDLTMERTTSLKGLASKLPARVLDTARVEVPRLGPRWSGTAAPRLARLSDVLSRFGGSTVLCIEAKDDRAFDPMVAMIKTMRLQSSIIIKVYATSKRLRQAQQEGFPVFGYLGNDQDTTSKNIAELGANLNAATDVLVLPARIRGELTPQTLLSQAVASRLPVWVFPVHRRSEVEYFTAQGVEGIVAADLPYLIRTSDIVDRDDWAGGAISPGELTKDPYNEVFALRWPGKAALTLDFAKKPSFVLFGQFCPIPFGAQRYTITFDARYDRLPTDRSTHISIAFGHQDDRYYVHQGGTANGYHAILRANGQLGLYSHLQGKTIGSQLGRSFAGEPMKAGQWYQMTLEVTPDRFYWTRGGGGAIEAVDSRFRGGYFHIGRSGTDGPLSLRNLRVRTD